MNRNGTCASNNSALLKELEALFDHAHPDRLQKNIEHVFFKYLMHEQPHLLPMDLHKISSDIYALIEFLHHAKSIKEKYTKDNGNQ